MRMLGKVYFLQDNCIYGCCPGFRGRNAKKKTRRIQRRKEKQAIKISEPN